MSAANHHAFYVTRNTASETGATEPDQQLSKLTSLIGKVRSASRVLSFPQRRSREHYYFFLGHVAAIRGNRCWKNESFQNWLAFEDVRNTFLPNVRIRQPCNETSCPRRTETLRYPIQKKFKLIMITVLLASHKLWNQCLCFRFIFILRAAEFFGSSTYHKP
jgi:hypothetical protein